MKNTVKLFAFLFLLAQVTMNAQEKRIPFSKGTLKICSSKNFQIKGYDGKEVIIKRIDDFKENLSMIKILQSQKRLKTKKLQKQKRLKTLKSKRNFLYYAKNNILFSTDDDKRTKGLKKLGKYNVDEWLLLNFKQSDNELLITDPEIKDTFIMISDESYEILVPNSLKLVWDTVSCKKTGSFKVDMLVVYDSKESSIENFEGELSVSSSLKNLRLTDVTGPVSINSLGGNVKIIFDKKLPKKLYSVYSNNGFIDVTLPTNSSVLMDVKGAEIYSNLDFKFLDDKVEGGMQVMKLKLNKGKTKFKLNSDLGSIYLRKK